jgi:hypothetical protein
MIRSTATTMMLSLLLVAEVAWPGPAAAGEMVVGNGQRTSETRSVGDFQSIAIGDGIDLKLKQAESTQVTVHGDANVLAWVELGIAADKTLRVRWKRGTSVRTRSPVVVEVAAPMIRSVAAEGSGAVDIDALKVPHFALSLSGSGDARARGLQHDELSVAITGSGDVKLAGESGRVRISISGSGDVDAAQLTASDVTVNIAGSGDAAVQASRALNVSVAGSGHVVYSGAPSVNQAVAGSGSVRRR